MPKLSALVALPDSRSILAGVALTPQLPAAPTFGWSPAGLEALPFAVERHLMAFVSGHCFRLVVRPVRGEALVVATRSGVLVVGVLLVPHALQTAPLWRP